MASAYTTLYPTSGRRDQINEPRNITTAHDPQYVQQIPPSTPVTSSGLQPSYSPQFRSNSGSPALNNTATPAESESTLSVHYQSSEFSEGDDPYFGINFANIDGGSPSFLGEPFAQLFKDGQLNGQTEPQAAAALENIHDLLPQGSAYFPMSPDRTPSLHTSSPNGERRGGRATFPTIHTDLSVKPEFGLLRQDSGPNSKHPNSQFTPDTIESGRSSDDGLAPAALIKPGQSPQVTVSVWGKDEVVVPYDLADDNQSFLFNGANDQQASQSQNQRSLSPSRDGTGRWVPNQATGQSGLDPSNRPATEVPSMNEMAANRKAEEKNQEVDGWLDKHPNDGYNNDNEGTAHQPGDAQDNVPQREIALGSETENRRVDGQTYYVEEGGGELTEQDVELMRSNRNWADAPLPFAISKPESTRYQPETSQAAIDKFERLCRDNDSVVSRAATWGTRRRSLPSISDIEGITGGNFLKKLTLNRSDARRPSILQELRGLVKKPSTNLQKRTRTENDEVSGTKTPVGRKETLGLAPPSRSLSWNKKQDVPSINTAFVAMGSNMASIGATHTRSGSISATPITSPKSPSNFTLSVKKPLSRIRSKSDLPKNTQAGLADLWRKSGGPPVAHLAKPPNNAPEAEDDEDEDEDAYEDSEIKNEANKLIEEITPNFAGFQQHVLKLNPGLEKQNNYLVDRIAHQQIIRYKSLLNARVKHLQHVPNGTCSAGAMCIAQGGSANSLDNKGDARGLDPMSAQYNGSDGDVTPLEGVISQESFPADIPMPPTATLPAEFECQLCFQAKKFQKPSDWTKHVHEDVQPFTCTWDRCRDPKIFKRKADWVRHENEGHRHLEWWTCDVEDCRHVCYRRDNFLQHLVREHKFTEPRIKTKAAIKRMGNNDPTWQKVDRCHEETRVEPQDEPCRFCGKTFPTWKKLTVHLAKHMEQISLPILKLVAKKELEADTIISPVQEPPPRQFPTTFPVKREPNTYDPSPISQTPLSAQHPGHGMGFSHSPQHPTPTHQYPQPLMYPIVPPSYQGPIFNAAGYDGLPQAMSAASINPANHGYASIDTHTHAYTGLQPVVTTVATGAGSYMVQAPSHNHGHSYHHMPGTGSLSISVPQQPQTVVPDVTSGMEAFPTLSLNPLGLQDPTQQGMHGYNQQLPPQHQHQHHGMMDPHSAGANGVVGDQYSAQGGSVSPFDRSPHQQQQQQQQNFYSQ